MVDERAVTALGGLIPDSERIVWAQQPKFSFKSEYNLKIVGSLLAFVIFWNLFFILTAGPSNVDLGAATRIPILIPLTFIFIFGGLFWICLKPKFDSFVVTDKAFYARRRGFIGWRVGRIPRHKVLSAKLLFGMKSCTTVGYAPLNNFKAAWNGIQDVSVSIGFWIRHAVHVRDVDHMDAFISLLSSESALAGDA